MNIMKSLMGLVIFGSLCSSGESAQKSLLGKDQAIADRMAFEKEQAQKKLAQREEDQQKGLAQQRVKIGRPPQTDNSPQGYSHQDGASFASSLMSGVVGAAKSTNPHTIPGFKTDKPRESTLNSSTIGDAALVVASTNEVSQHLTVQAQRQNFKIDPNTDPLFVEANQVVADPLKSLNEEVTEIPEAQGFEEIKTCEEGGDEYQKSCSKHLEIELKITPPTTRSVLYCPGHKERNFPDLHYSHWTCAGCETKHEYVPKKVEVIREEWSKECSLLENMVDKGLCRYTDASRSTQNETKMIQEEPITRDHFEEHYQFACFKPSQNSCNGLREQGCYQIRSTCKEQKGESCFLWEQTFKCPSGKRFGKSYRSANKKNPFCLTGNCADTSYEANNELFSVMSHLSVLREAQNDLRNFAVIFKGQHRWCTRNLWDFRDCCGSGKGWGVTLHLSSCDAAEVELRTLRDKKLCIQVGTYCAERHLGQCTRKKTTFCCYGTKIARLIQQSGHAQLGLGWVRVESPNCGGLSPEQLSRMDFSQIDFSEIFEDIKKQTVVKDQKQSLAEVSSTRLRDNMNLLTKPPANSSTSREYQQLKEKGL
jgi:hypothetical protein